MERSKVYFTDFRTGLGTPLTVKLQKLIKLAGISSIDMNGKFVAIKMHFGELGNLAYLRPNYAKAVADVIKENGGLPFLTDCNTLYPGSRKNALEHMDCANINGFNTVTTGCQIIIADGLRGTDDIIVPVPNGEYCKEAYIGRAVMDADIFVSLTHFKGHEAAGFGGTIKNIGMGCGSRAGKMQQHQSGHPHVITDICRGCRRCSKECGSDAIRYDNNKAWIDPGKCKGCGRCIGACAFDAIENDNWARSEEIKFRNLNIFQLYRLFINKPCIGKIDIESANLIEKLFKNILETHDILVFTNNIIGQQFCLEQKVARIKAETLGAMLVGSIQHIIIEIALPYNDGTRRTRIRRSP